MSTYLSPPMIPVCLALLLQEASPDHIVSFASLSLLCCLLFSQHVAPHDLILKIFTIKLLTPTPTDAQTLLGRTGDLFCSSLSLASRHWVWVCEPPNTYLMARSVNGTFCNAIIKLKKLFTDEQF